HYGSPWNVTQRYYLGGMCVGGSCQDYYTDSIRHYTYFPQTYGLVLTALALSVFELAFLILAIFERKFAVGILVSGLLGSITLMVAPIYFYFTLPVVLSSDGAFFTSFFGSYTDRGTTYTWGGGPGWFMAASVTRLNWTMKSAAVAASAASKITSASGLPSSPRNSWTMTLFGIFGCLNRRVASSHCPGRTLSCVTKSMASRRAHQGPTLYNDAVPATDRRRRSPRSDGCGHGSDGTGPPWSRGSCRTTAAGDPRRRRAPPRYRGAGRRTRRASGSSAPRPWTGSSGRATIGP